MLDYAKSTAVYEAAAASHENWQAPDWSLLQTTFVEPPKFPMQLFGNWKSWVEKAAFASSAPPDYVGFGLLAHAAALIGNTVRILPDPKNASNWSEPIALWIALIGPPSSGKTPALAFFKQAFNKIENDLQCEFDEKFKEWVSANKKKEAQLPPPPFLAALIDPGEGSEDALARAPVDIPQEPVLQRIRVMDSTIEKLGTTLSENPRGVLQFRDELAAWFVDMGRYSAGSDRQSWLEFYNGETIMIDRVKHAKPIRIENALASVLGGLQPGRLEEFLDTADDGLMARFLFTSPDIPPLERGNGAPEKDQLYLAFKRLLGISFDALGEPNLINFDEDASNVFFQFRNDVRQLCQDTDGFLGGWIGKGPGLVCRLAAVFRLLDWADADYEDLPPEIGTDVLNRALTLWKDYLLPMARRTFGEAVLPIEERLARRILREVRHRKVRTVNAREVRREWSIPELGKKTENATKAFKLLEELGWLKPAGQRAGDSKGRNSKDFEVNPLLFGPNGTNGTNGTCH